MRNAGLEQRAGEGGAVNWLPWSVLKNLRLAEHSNTLSHTPSWTSAKIACGS
jgi:hypothetical protein